MTNKLLQKIALISLTGLFACGQVKNINQADINNPWSGLSEIKKQIKAPQFKDKDFSILQYGASSDSTVLSTKAFNEAIIACSESGGGRVIVPKGTFLSGAIHLKSNVNLHLEDGAKIKFSRNPDDYLPVVFSRWEGMELMNYSPLIYAYEQENVAVTGNGILDGNASNKYWWPWKARTDFGWKAGMDNQLADVAKLTKQNKDGVNPRERIYGKGHFLRPSFIQTYLCKNVLISDIKIINAPFWNIHPVLCENVSVLKVKIQTHGPNNDGCDPESCKNVLIKDCFFDTGDDCIAIKSGRNEDGRKIGKPAENHIIENCEMKEGHGGVVIGSEISGGAKNIFAQNLIMDSPNLDRVLRIKTSSLRGGVIENVFLRNIEVGTYQESAIRCNMFYENPGDFIPTIRNIVVENMNVKKGGKYAVLIDAYEQSPVENLRLINCNINGVEIPLKSNHTKNMVFENVFINGQKFEVPAK